MGEGERKNVRLDAALLFFAALALRLAALTLHPVWTDEAMTIYVAQWDLARLVETVIAVDVNPPLYYVYLWAWSRLGDAVWIARLSSALPGALAIGVTYLLGRELYGRRAGLFAGALFALTPLHVFQSNQARYPALIAFFAVAAAWFLLKLVRAGRARTAAGFAAFAAAMLLTHYYGYFIVAGFFVYSAVAFRRSENKTALVGSWAAVGVVFAAWLWFFIRQFATHQASGGGEHVPWPLVASLIPIYFTTGYTDWNLPQFLPHLLLPNDLAAGRWGIFASGMLAIPAWLLAVLGIVSPKSDGADNRLAPLWFAVPLVLFFAASLVFNIFKPYYFAPFLPAFAVLAGRGAIALADRNRVIGVSIAVLALAIPAAALTDYYHPKVFKEDWKAVARTLADEGEAGDVVLHFNFASKECLAYYDDSGLPARYVTENHEDVHIVSPGMPEEIFDDLERTYRRIWIVGYYPMFVDPSDATMAYARENLYPLEFESQVPYDPRFHLALFTPHEDVLLATYASAIDFAAPRHAKSQLGEGFFPGEGVWRWIGEEATAVLAHREGQTRVSVHGAANVEVLGGDVEVEVSCSGGIAGTIVVTESGTFDGTFALPETCLGEKAVAIRLAASRSFVPDDVFEDGDTTKKSVMIGRIALEP